MPHGILPRYEDRRKDPSRPVGPGLWSESKCMFITLYRLTGKRDAAMELADEFITWPIGPGNVPTRPEDRQMLGWIQQYDEGRYDPPNPKIVTRFEERWNQAFKDQYRQLGIEGVKTTLELLKQSREGKLARAVDLEYAKNTAWAGAEGLSKLREPEQTQQRMVGAVRIITPLTNKKLAKRANKQKQLKAPVEGEFRVVE